MAKKKSKTKQGDWVPQVYELKSGIRVLWFDPDSEVTDPDKSGQLATITDVPPDNNIVKIKKDDGGEAEVPVSEIQKPLPDQDDIYARCDSGYYNVHDYPERPKPPVKPSRDAEPQAHREYADYLEHYNKAKAEYREQWQTVRARQSQLDNLFKQELLAYLHVPEDHPKADKLFALAWEEGHSNGYANVIHYAEEFVELIRDDPKKVGEAKFATVSWTAHDIKDKKPRWSLSKCEDWLADNARQIQDDMCSRGWESIDTLLSMSD